MDWIKPDITLKGELVELIPLEEKHIVELELLALEYKEKLRKYF